MCCSTSIIYTYTHTFTYLLKRVCNTVQFVLKSFKRKIELSNFIKNTILVHISFHFFPLAYLLVSNYITLYLFLFFAPLNFNFYALCVTQDENMDGKCSFMHLHKEDKQLRLYAIKPIKLNNRGKEWRKN